MARRSFRGERLTWAIIVGAILVAACGGDRATSSTPVSSPATTPATASGLVLAGDPASPGGATWTYRAVDASIAYDLAGVLFKPAGSGPFPAVIVSHGKGGSAFALPRAVGATMVGWGAVVIATHYTHSAGVPIGSPGTAADQGASPANVLRARKLVDVLAGLGYVDTRRVAAYGHSAGAFVTAAFAGTHPDALRVAAHCAGGVGDGPLAIATSEAQAQGIRVPYQMHHGDADAVVALRLDERLASILSAQAVEHELVVYEGQGHDIGQSPEVLAAVREWYAAHGLF
jgi:dienelactone hydrolase